MAFRPCVSCGRKFFGGSDYTYVTWWAGEEKFNFRLVQCTSCASELRNSAAASGDARQGDEWRVSEQQLDLHQVLELQGAGPQLNGAAVVADGPADRRRGNARG